MTKETKKNLIVLGSVVVSFWVLLLLHGLLYDFADKRAKVKVERQDYGGAVADYDILIKLTPDFLGYKNAYNNRGFAKSELGDIQGAIADYTKAIGQDADFALAYSNRGRAYMRLGQKSKALTDFMRAIELGESVPQLLLDWCK